MSSSISVGTSYWVYTVAAYMNTQGNIDPLVIGDGETYVTITWRTLSGLGTDEIWGGKIFIRRI